MPRVALVPIGLCALACAGLTTPPPPPAPPPPPKVPDVRMGTAIWLKPGNGDCRLARYVMVREGPIIGDHEERLYGVAPHPCTVGAGWAVDPTQKKALAWGLLENQPPYGPFDYQMSDGKVEELPALPDNNGRPSLVAFLDDGRIAAFVEAEYKDPPTEHRHLLPPAEADPDKLGDTEELVWTVGYTLEGGAWKAQEAVQWITEPMEIAHACDLDLRAHVVGTSSAPDCKFFWGGPEKAHPAGVDQRALEEAAGRRFKTYEWIEAESQAGTIATAQNRDEHATYSVVLWKQPTGWNLLENDLTNEVISASGHLLVREDAGKARFTHLDADPRSLAIDPAIAARAVGP